MFEILKGLYQFKILIYTLVVRELKARYRGTFMGIFWTMLNPLLLMLVYKLVFSFIMRVKMENYLVYMFVGLLPWLWFSSSLLDGTNSVVAGGNMVKKTLFPAEILPVVYVLSNMANFFLSLPVLFVLMFIFGVKIGFSVMYLPFIIFVQLLFSLGLVFFLAAVNVWFRDVQQLVGNLLNLWFYLTPVIYTISLVPEWAKKLFYLNPFYTIVSAYQDTLFFNKSPNFISLGILFAVSLIIFSLGQSFFRRHQDYFAEEI